MITIYKRYNKEYRLENNIRLVKETMLYNYKSLKEIIYIYVTYHCKLAAIKKRLF